MEALRRSLQGEEQAAAASEPVSPPHVINLMEALRRSLQGEEQAAGHQAEESMFRDTDAILARIESGLASERAAMDALLKRMTGAAA
jgi:hypothetical protein